jgi:hypothetical protein
LSATSEVVVTSGTPFTFDTFTISNVKAGDVVEVWFGPAILYAAAGGTGEFRAYFADTTPKTHAVSITDVPKSISMVARHVVQTTASSLVVTLQLNGDGTYASTVDFEHMVGSDAFHALMKVRSGTATIS